MIEALERRLAALVAARSVSSHHPALEDPPDHVVAVLREQLDAIGAHCQVHTVSERGRPVLTADIGPVDRPFGAVLLGHIDTVPAVEPDCWSGDPWQLARRDQRWTGLGTADMKGFFACAGTVLERMRNRLAKRIRIIATTDEESGMQGMRGAVEHGLVPLAPVVVGEPTGGAVAGGCRGLVAFRIVLSGIEGHSSQPPEHGRAIDALGALIRTAREQERAWGTAADRKHGAATMNLGRVHGGDAFNRLVARITVDGEMRLPPGMSIADAEAVLDRLVGAARQEGVGAEVEILERFLPCINPDDGALPIMPYVCEASLLPRGQAFRIWGPGDLDQAHRIDESLDIETAARYCDDLEAWLMECCG
ncbi:MAG: M20/M25/M40 family metallo-hydrolase [Candidatus Dadabacteria bacterium]|nr:MAG: M20/M25/M40 family metallo-hydrolase [Candidatus Dadabacteria bacterium]